jgi:hypothetical protein
MPDQLQLRGGTTVQHSTFTGASKEVTVDTTKKTAVVHDGATAGGNPLMREDASNAALALGSAATPSLKFTGDTNTGIYSPGADQVAISTGGSGRLFVDSAGKVGIGGASVAGLLQLKYATDVHTSFRNATAGGLSAGTLIESVNDAFNSYNPIYLKGSQFAFGTDAAGSFSERLRITSAGLVGVGTSSPSRQLDVLVADNTTYAGNADNANALNLFNTSTTNETFSSIRLGAQGSGSAGLVTLYGVQTANAAGSGYFAIATRNAGTFAERFRITPGGNVCIGTSASGVKLHVVDESTTDEVARFYSNAAKTVAVCSIWQDGAGASGAALKIRNDGTGNALEVHDGSDGNRTFVIDTANRVGIGTATPGHNLEIKGSFPDFAISDSDTANDKFRILHNSGGTQLQVDPNNVSANSYLLVSVDNTERARIDSSGRLLVGTSSTSEVGRAVFQGNSASSTGTSIVKLTLGNASPGSADELGKIQFADSSHVNAAQIAGLRDGGTWTSGSSQPSLLGFYTTPNGTATPVAALFIRQNGKLESDTTYAATTANAANLHIDSGGFFLRSTSSAKYKTDIETLQDSYSDAILGIRPVWYRSTCENDNPTDSWWGFIAEEVAAIDPRLVQWKTVSVSYDENGAPVQEACDPEPDGVAYERFVPHLLNLIKRQKEQIKAIESRLSALEQS